MGKNTTTKPTADPQVNDAIKTMADKLGMAELDALNLVVSVGVEKMTQDMGARAFVQGEAVQMAGSDAKSAPKKLLGHELTHVTQSRSLSESAGDLERAASKAAFFARKNKASSDATSQ